MFTKSGYGKYIYLVYLLAESENFALEIHTGFGVLIKTGYWIIIP